MGGGGDGDPDQSGALKTMADLPAGGVALAEIGAGLMLYGIYAITRPRYQPM
ncbi:DUF1206 domain-containing protein [Brachybacterium sp. Marseille-Q7125]|uniref:DUF1206 domain-containing protein n=1 Tax=Brachybacterium sp. Marseille-Q7125 TaxID=2932815 RepID=UPI00248B79F8|nr:DUF1206 domain-containing protein [Brachybacterium sp. Marseille-Q7125]